MCVSVIGKFLTYISPTVIYPLIFVLVVFRFLHVFHTFINCSHARIVSL